MHALVGRVRQLLDDPQLLRERGYRSKFSLLADLEIDAPSFRRGLRHETISERNLERIASKLAVGNVSEQIAAMYRAAASVRQPPKAISLLLARKIDDRLFWEREFRRLRLAHGHFSETMAVSDMYPLFDLAISQPRLRGDFEIAMRNGLIALQWWLHNNNGTLEDTQIGSTCLLWLAHAAGQAENLPMHKRTLKLGRLIFERNPRCLLTLRLVQDIEAQVLYNLNPEHRGTLRKALRIHDAELETADKIVETYRQPPPVSDILQVVGESYYNRLNILVKLGMSGFAFRAAFKRMEGESLSIMATLSRSSRHDLNSNLGMEGAYFRRILCVRQLLAERNAPKAVDTADNLLASIQSLKQDLPFVAGYANYWAGVAKRRAAREAAAPRVLQELHDHASAAIRAFGLVGNQRMRRNVARDLTQLERGA